MQEKRYFPGISTVTFSNGTRAPFVTGGLAVKSDGTPLYVSSTEMLTSGGWVKSVQLPVPMYSHSQTSYGQKVKVA
jgi:hypothetical protein